LRKKLAIFLLMILCAAPAAAACNPPPGLPLQQFYALCANDLQQQYIQNGGPRAGVPFQIYVQSIYQSYMQTSARMLGGGMGAAPPAYSAPGGNFLCALGTTQCFNGYLRKCEPMPTGGSWWITGAQECR
jgi:hypothetical protein